MISNVHLLFVILLSIASNPANFAIENGIRKKYRIAAKFAAPSLLQRSSDRIIFFPSNALATNFPHFEYFSDRHSFRSCRLNGKWE